MMVWSMRYQTCTKRCLSLHDWQQLLWQEHATVDTVHLCSWINEDQVCNAQLRHADRNNDKTGWTSFAWAADAQQQLASFSRGSVAKHLRCCEIFNNHFTTNVLKNLSVEEFWKSVKIWQSYCHKCQRSFFETQCIFGSYDQHSTAQH